jgi:O-antigen ligase
VCIGRELASVSGVTYPVVGRVGDRRAATIARISVLAAFPLSLTSPGTTIAMALAAICGVYLWIRNEGLPRDIAYAGGFAASLYLLLLLVDVINGGGAANFLQTGVNYLPLLALAPLALAIRRSNVTVEAIDRALQVTLLLAAAISLVSWLIGDPRPGGLNLNPIPYGFAILLSGTLLLFRGMQPGGHRLSVTCALLALVPIVLTGSKIIWGCTIVSYGIAGAYWIVAYRRWKAIVPILAGALAVLVAAYVTFARRLEAFWAELQEYAEAGVSYGATFGHRMELATSGWRAFLERPIFGYGFDERMPAAFAHRTAGGPEITIRDHFHNDYITHLVSYGIFGSLFLVLFFAFFARQAALSNVGAYRRAGYVFVVILAMYMTVEIAFNMDPISGPMAVFLALFLASRVELGEGTQSY